MYRQSRSGVLQIAARYRPTTLPGLRQMARPPALASVGMLHLMTARGMAHVPRGEDRYVRIVEVSPRDGLQNLPPPAVSLDIRKELVERLLRAGVRNIEVGSFVRKERVPQMVGTEELLLMLPSFSSGISPRTSKVPGWDQGVHYTVLVPNAGGLENLFRLEEQFQGKNDKQRLTDEIAVFVSATDAFSKANNGAPVEKVLAGLPELIQRAGARGYRTRGYVSCVMTDPFSGRTEPLKVAEVARKLLDMGCYEVSLGDITGEGNPELWKRLWEEIRSQGLPMNKVAAHCHDTFSMALSSILALLPLGLRSIDSSLDGLGGCPYSPGATGNVSTEDVVYALHTLGYQTGIDLDKLVEAGAWLSTTLGIRNESRVGRAMWARRQLTRRR